MEISSEKGGDERILPTDCRSDAEEKASTNWSHPVARHACSSRDSGVASRSWVFNRPSHSQHGPPRVRVVVSRHRWDMGSE